MRFILFILILFSLKTRSQETVPVIRYTNAVWLGYFSSINFKKHWSVNTDLQYRMKNWLANPSQALVRSGLAYRLNDKVRFTIGIAHFRFYLDNVVTRGEWRPWQEILLTNDINKVKIAHRLRAEQRFNESTRKGKPSGEYLFNWRFRYRIELQIPVLRKNGKSISMIGGDELLVNAGKNIRYNYFDQNRLYAGINFEQNKNLTYQIQFMKIWQQQSNGLTLDDISVIRLNVFHKINL